MRLTVDHGIMAALFVVSLTVYLASRTTRGASDTVGNSLLGASLVRDGSLNFDGFRNGHYWGPPALYPIQGWFADVHGHLVSAYPIGAGLVVLPLEVAEALYLKLSFRSAGLEVDPTTADFEPYRLYFEKLNSSIVAALCVVVAYAVLRRVFDRRTSVLAAGLLAFGTALWFTLSQGLWQHGPLLLVLLLAVRCMLVLPTRPRAHLLAFVAAGALFGFAFGIRPTAVAYGVVMALFLPRLAAGRAATIGFVASFVTVVAAWGASNKHTYGGFVGGYGVKGARVLYNFDVVPTLGRFAGLVFSPGRGLLVYSPILVLALIVALVHRRPWTAQPLFVALLAGAAVIFVSYCFFIPWYGGGSYGPRLLSDTLVAFVIPLGAAVDWCRRRWWRATAVAAVAAWSMFVAFVGAFGLPGTDWGWAPPDPASRFWDLRDSPIERQLHGTIRRFAMLDQPLYLSGLDGRFATIAGQTCAPGSVIHLPAAPAELTAEARNTGRSRWFGFRDSPAKGEVRVLLRLEGPTSADGRLYIGKPTSAGHRAVAVGVLPASLKPGSYKLQASLVADRLAQLRGSVTSCTAEVS